MSILQIGMGKSGNLWLYQIVQHLLKISGQEIKSFIQTQSIYPIAKTWDLSFKDQAGVDCITIEPAGVYYRISSIFRMPIQDIQAYADACSHVWLQSMPCARTENTLSAFKKSVYILRDPRDAIVSNSKYAFTPYRKKYAPHTFENPESLLQYRLTEDLIQWVRHVTGYLLLKEKLHIHFIFYENLLRDVDNELLQLAKYLEIPLTSEQCASVREGVSFSSMKEKDPNHVRKGEKAQWKSLFTKQQQKMADEVSGELLEWLQYTQDTPRLPKDYSEKALQNILSRANRKYFLYKVKKKISEKLLPHSFFVFK